MTFDDFCAAVRAEFPGVHFTLDETPDLPHRASVGRISIARRSEIKERHVGAWAVEYGNGAVTQCGTLKEARGRLLRDVFDFMIDARSLGILPLNYALALDASDAVVKEDLAAMDPVERDAANDRLKTEIRRRLAALKERNQ